MARGEMRRSVSVTESDYPDSVLDRRRNGLADIFEDQSEEVVKHVIELFKCLRSNSVCGNTEDDISSSVEYKVKSNTSNEYVKNEVILANSDSVLNINTNSEMFPEIDNEQAHMNHRCTLYRRFAMPDIYHNINDIDILELLALYSEHSMDPEVKTNPHRRRGLHNVLEGLTDEQHNSLIQMFRDFKNRSSDDEGFSEIDSVDMSVTEDEDCENGCRQSRRFALADIYDHVSKEERNSFIKLLSQQDSTNDVGTYSYGRRPGLSNIFDNVSQVDLDNLLSKYSNNSV